MKSSKKLTRTLLLLITISILLLSCSNISGKYTADLTIMQSGYMTTFNIKSDGTALIIENDGKTAHTFWERNSGSCIMVYDRHGAGYNYFIDLKRNKIYYGAEDWRSNINGHKFHKH